MIMRFLKMDIEIDRIQSQKRKKIGQNLYDV